MEFCRRNQTHMCNSSRILHLRLLGVQHSEVPRSPTLMTHRQACDDMTWLAVFWTFCCVQLLIGHTQGEQCWRAFAEDTMRTESADCRGDMQPEPSWLEHPHVFCCPPAKSMPCPSQSAAAANACEQENICAQWECLQDMRMPRACQVVQGNTAGTSLALMHTD